MSKIKTALGLMSGTSMDGIDVALLKTDGLSLVERGASSFFAYGSQTRTRLQQAMMDATSITDDRIARPGILLEIEREVTELHVSAVQTFLDQQGMEPNEVDVLGFHGQTVLHRPDQALTVQLGEGQSLADATGIATVYDMRAKDMETGGQGAPLIPVYHQSLATNLADAYSKSSPVVFVNIGGISNITYVDDDTLIAFDSGPGNALIDQWVQAHVGISHDQGGMIAAEGQVDDRFVQSFLEDEFFKRAIPKSLDRGDFLLPEQTELSVETVARSLACITASAILKSSNHLPKPPKLWVICGGGRHNPHIMSDLRAGAATQNAEVVSAEEAGFDGDAMEAEGWAYLAVRSLQNFPLTFPKTTGCSEPVSGGVLVTPVSA